MRRSLLNGLLLLGLLALFSLGGCTEWERPPVAQDGVLDFSQWNFETGGPVELAGQWEIYWHELLTPVDFTRSVPPEPTGFFPSHSAWYGSSVNNVPLSHKGYATYRMQVRMPAEGPPLVFQIKKGAGGLKVWLEDDLVLETGEVGKSAEAVRRSFSAPVIRPAGGGQQIQMVLQLASFAPYTHFGAGGEIAIGKIEDFRRDNIVRTVIDLFILGALVFMGLYHLILYFFRKKEISNLYFSAVCLIYGLWSVYYGLGSSYWMMILLDGEAMFNFMMTLDMFFYLLVPTLVMFVHAMFPRECSLWAVRLFQVAGLAWFLVNTLVLYFPGLADVRAVEVLHLAMDNPRLRPFEFIALASGIYMLGAIAVAAMRKQPNAILMLGSLSLIVACAVNDVVHLFTNISLRISGIGFFSMLVFQSLVLAGRFSRSFKEVERLSLELGDNNITLSRMDKLKDQFLANTSHELRTPLSGIIGISEALMQGAAGDISSKARRNLEAIVSSGKRLSILVNDILDFSRLKNKDIELKIRPVDARSLVEGVLAVSSHLAEGKGLELVNEIPVDTPYVAADEDRLYQIMFNLVGNAVKFTDEGGIRVSADHTDGQVTITVADTGIGIPPDKIETVFKAFQQVDTGDSRAFGGTGLGLGISKYLVALHGGRLSVASEPDRGSQFYFTLPVGIGTPESAENSAVISTIENNTIKYMPMGEEKLIASMQEGLRDFGDEGVQVLIVDDDPVNLRVASNYLALDGVFSRSVSSGMDALDLIKSGFSVDLVLLDIMMPQMNGYEVCEKLRETFAPSELPIIMLTAKNRTSDLEKGFSMGANDYLAKPYSREELISRVRAHLDIKAAYQTLKEKKALEKEVVHRKRQEEKALHQADKEAFEKLRYQLNPHFLFNALAAIRGAVTRDPKVAHSMVTHLAEFTRMALSRGAIDRLTIGREMVLINHYLAMEQIRFGDYLEVIIDIQRDVAEVEIPALVMQPLVENAVKYGSRTSPDVLEVGITAEKADAKTMKMTITNTGTWVESEDVDISRSTGTGLNNVKQRLESYYHDAHGFDVSIDNGKVAVVLSLPLVMPGNGEAEE